MAQITAADVSKLRKATGAGMMDCKKALQEAEGDFDKAVELIRKKGQAIANKRADREAGEGVVLAKTSEDESYSAIVVLNCETDFVAKNKDFVDFAEKILDNALEMKPQDLDSLKKAPMGNQTIAEVVTEKTGIIGEKLALSYFEGLSAEKCVAYIHPGNKLATIAGFSKGGFDEQIYRNIAMQIAAMNPVAVDKDDVPEEIIEKELEIGRDQARQEGKPEQLIDKIAQGKLGKFFKENTLMNQEFIKDGKKTIKQYLSETDKELKVTAFKRFTLNT